MNVYINNFTAKYCFSKLSLIGIVSFVKVFFSIRISHQEFDNGTGEVCQGLISLVSRHGQ